MKMLDDITHKMVYYRSYSLQTCDRNTYLQCLEEFIVSNLLCIKYVTCVYVCNALEKSTFFLNILKHFL